MSQSELWSETVEHSSDGVLSVGGCSVRDLAERFGTPLFVVDEADFRARARKARGAFESAFAPYGASVDVYYAGKAFLTSQIATWIRDEGLSLDIAYEGELQLALRGGMPTERMAMHGNNKSRHDISLALKKGVGRLIV